MRSKRFEIADLSERAGDKQFYCLEEATAFSPRLQPGDFRRTQSKAVKRRKQLSPFHGLKPHYHKPQAEAWGQSTLLRSFAAKQHTEGSSNDRANVKIDTGPYELIPWRAKSTHDLVAGPRWPQGCAGKFRWDR